MRRLLLLLLLLPGCYAEPTGKCIADGCDDGDACVDIGCRLRAVDGACPDGMSLKCRLPAECQVEDCVCVEICSGPTDV